MATRMQQRRGTAAQWVSVNSGSGPVLEVAEIGFESDTGKFKIGDGVNHWIDLAYFVDADSLIDGAPGLLDTLNELAASINDDPNFFTTVATNLSNHESDTTNVHGIANTADLATKSYADSAVSTHSLDTTNVHGILDTNELATKAYVADAVSNATVDQSALAGEGIAWNIVTDQFDIDSTVVTLDGLQTLTNKTINANANTITVTSANVSDFNEAAQDAVGTILTGGLTYSDSAPGIGINYVTLGDTLLDGVSGASYGLIGTSTYLDVKNTNGYNKEIELDIAAVKSQLNTDGYITTSSTSTLTNKTLTSPKINEDVAVTATATELNYVDGVTSSIQTQLDDKLSKTGGTMSGPLTLSGGPTLDLHAATKLYVDNVTAGINFHQAAHVATTANLSADYNNGTNGIGATLTATANGEWTILDGHTTFTQYDRILVKDQTDAKQNGIYILSDFGSGSSKWILTRASDADNNPAGEMKNGDFVLVLNGIINASYGFVNNSTANPIAIGLDNITYVPFNAAKSVAAGNGLQEATPGVISIDTSITQTRVSGVSDTEIGYLDGVTSPIQSQLNDKSPSNNPTFTGTVILPSTTSIGDVSATELGYINGATSNIQTQINSKLDSSTASTTYAPIASPTFTGTVSGITATMVGLGNVDNTSDASKPISSATQSALDLKANLASPTFTGTVTLPVGTSGANLINIPNSALTNSSITINGSAVSLGGTIAVEVAGDSDQIILPVQIFS